MFGQQPASAGLSTVSANDPNDLLRRIDQQTTQMFHWVRAGVIATIVLLIAILLGF